MIEFFLTQSLKIYFLRVIVKIQLKKMTSSLKNQKNAFSGLPIQIGCLTPSRLPVIFSVFLLLLSVNRLQSSKSVLVCEIPESDLDFGPHFAYCPCYKVSGLIQFLNAELNIGKTLEHPFLHFSVVDSSTAFNIIPYSNSCRPYLINY